MPEAHGNPSDVQPSTAASRPLVRHVRRAGWGRALMLWERENKRAYQFEDGELRVFAKPYYELLQPAAKPDPVLRHRLREKAVADGHVPTRNTPGRKKQRPVAPRPTLDDQVTVFEGLFPEGFHGNAWSDSKRLRLQGRRLKRHRDPAISEARERLERSLLQAFIDASDHAAVTHAVVDVVGRTDLATRKQIGVLAKLPADAELAEAMLGYLHEVRDGDLGPMARLRRALARLGVRTVAWPALTAPRALLHPADHMCVRPSVARAQAKLILPDYKLDSSPSAVHYSRCLELAMSVREHLTRAGFAPRDLFDVTDFMHVTLSTSVKQLLLEAMVRRRANEADKDPAHALEPKSSTM